MGITRSSALALIIGPLAVAMVGNRTTSLGVFTVSTVAAAS
jgi:hypothetical protein